MSSEKKRCRDYDALHAKYRELKAAKEKLMSSNQELQDALETLKLRNEELRSLSDNEFADGSHVMGELLDNSHSLNFISYIIEHNKSGIAIFDKEMRYLYVSQKYLDEYKIVDRAIIGKHHYEVFPDLPLKWKNVHTLTLQGKIFNGKDDPYYREDGRVTWTEWECRPWYLADGSIGGIITYTDVINERKQVELALKEKSEEINTFFDNAIDLLCIANTDGYFLRLNKEWESVLGFSLEEMEGKKFLDFVHPEDIKPTLNAISQLSNHTNMLNYTNRYRCKNGIYRWIEWKSTLVGNRIYAAARDITERIHQSEELIAAKEKAEESDRLKTAFLHNMSHEIRTPMNAIMGFSELLVQNFDNRAKLEQFSDIIKIRCNDLLDIINGLLDISNLESDKMPVHLANCRINDLFEELSLFFEEYKKRQKKYNISLNIYLLNNQDIMLFTDMGKLKQIFINLIGNAIKFTNEGSVEVSFTLDSADYITFFVKDTGIGIPKDKQQYIFDRFAQVDNGTKRLYGGTGLGLSIVKGLLDILGGTIWVESDTGLGSAFYFTIPIIKEKELNIIRQDLQD